MGGKIFFSKKSREVIQKFDFSVLKILQDNYRMFHQINDKISMKKLFKIKKFK